MVSRRPLVLASAALSVALAVISCARGDYFWIAVSGFSLFSLAFSRMTKSDKAACGAIVAWTIVPSVLQLGFIAADLSTDSLSDGSIAFNDVPVFVYMSSFSMALQGFVSGFSVLAVANASGKIMISRIWMLVFAMMMSLGVSVFCMFYAYGWLYFNGYPLTEPYFAELPEGKFMNGLVMASPIVTVISTLFFVVFGRVLVMGRTKESLTEDAA
ncbi:MAG: hypothetical protein E7Z68_03890 [Thermoplasmata archaeon]|jgi:hypothetical protein|nr:hypothetical protein [Thermoplasmata archaeon]